MLAPSTGSFEIELNSPARLSLFLRILGRTDDGFHESASLFQAVSLNDRLELARIPQSRDTFAGVVRPSRKQEPIKQHVEFSYSPNGLDLPSDQTNLVVRALTLFRSKLTERDGGSLDVPRFRAHLTKNIPIDAGLGGAASNAATALHGANELCGRPASSEELREWALDELGTDVAAFLGGTGSAYCTGRGVFLRAEAAEALPPLPSGLLEGSSSAWLLVVAPEVSLSTPAVFRKLAASQYSGLSAADPASLRDSFAAAPTLGVNDLHDDALQLCPELAVVSAALQREGFESVLLSGAGPCLYAVGPPQDGETAEAFAARFADAATAESGVPVRAWPVAFAKPDEETGWY